MSSARVFHLDPFNLVIIQFIHKTQEDVPKSNFLNLWDFIFQLYDFVDVYCDFNQVNILNLENPIVGSLNQTN